MNKGKYLIVLLGLVLIGALQGCSQSAIGGGGAQGSINQDDGSAATDSDVQQAEQIVVGRSQKVEVLQAIARAFNDRAQKETVFINDEPLSQSLSTQSESEDQDPYLWASIPDSFQISKIDME